MTGVQTCALPIYFKKILDYFEKKGIKSKISDIVVVDVKSFSKVTSPSYDLGLKKDDLIEKWKQYYN